jgi:hypothetical protein
MTTTMTRAVAVRFLRIRFCHVNIRIVNLIRFCWEQDDVRIEKFHNKIHNKNKADFQRYFWCV